MVTLRPVRICFPVLALKVKEGLFIDAREQPMSLVYQGGMSECWVDGGEVAVLLGGPEDFERGAFVVNSLRHCTAWTGVDFCKAPPPFHFHFQILHLIDWIDLFKSVIYFRVEWQV
jgi:hypothetical protein